MLPEVGKVQENADPLLDYQLRDEFPTAWLQRDVTVATAQDHDRQARVLPIRGRANAPRVALWVNDDDLLSGVMQLLGQLAREVALAGALDGQDGDALRHQFEREGQIWRENEL